MDEAMLGRLWANAGAAARRAVLLLGLLGLVGLAAACGSEEGSDAWSSALQAHHPNGAVLTVTGFEVSADHAAVAVIVTNGSGRTIRLADAGDLVLVDDRGNRYRLAVPPHDPSVTITPGATLEGRLVFLGRLHPEARTVTLITNERRGSETWDETPAPKMQLEIPVVMDHRVEPPQGGWQEGVEPSASLVSSVAVRSLPASELQVKEVAGGLEVTLQSDVLFAFDRHDLEPQAEAVLATLGQLLDRHPGASLEVRGHTDSVGSPAYNQRLSERRAESVRRYLVDRLGINPARITSAGFGAERPVAPNTHPDGSDNPEGRRLNRRVEVFVEGEGAQSRGSEDEGLPR